MVKLPVVAVIPAHNAAKTLPALLDELIAQKYDDIFVLDDASTDDTVKVTKSYGSKVKLVENDENVGSGANRNRIIGRTDKAILHFIDADMKLLSKNTPEIIRTIDWPQNLAFIGGMVRNPDGTQNPFNYGLRPHFFRSFIIGGIQMAIWSIGLYSRPAGRFLRKFFSPLLSTFPNIYGPYKARRIYWTAESNMLIKSDLFAEHGGYDPIFRYSEIEDFALRLYKHGYHGRFDPRIDAIHASNDNVFKSSKKRHTARLQFLKKHGLLAYFIPPLSDYLYRRRANVLAPSARRRRGMD